MSKTSSAAKAKYNAKVYSTLSLKLPKYLVKAFKDKCHTDGVSQASVIKGYMDQYLKPSE